MESYCIYSSVPLSFAQHSMSASSIFLKTLFYLGERVREQKQRRRVKGDGEADYLLSREPNAGLDPRVLGS